MKLYNLDNSPYASRVRIQIRHKGLPVEICDAPLALRTPEFAAEFPLAKLPILELDDGTHIAESTVIMDYLEDSFPEPALRPAEPLAAAQNGMLIRCADNHIAPALFPVFTAFLAPVEDAGMTEKLDGLARELNKLEALLASMPAREETGLQTGDIALSTVFYFIEYFADRYDLESLLAANQAVNSWWGWVQSVPAVGETIAELDAAHRAFVTRVKGE